MKSLLRFPAVAAFCLFLCSQASAQGFLGVSLKAAEEGNGAEIVSVQAGSAAEAADLRPGDRIVRIAGRSVRNLEDVSKVVAEHDPGDSITIVVLREGERVRVRARLGERPEIEEIEEAEEPPEEEMEDLEVAEEIEEAMEIPEFAEVRPDRQAWFGITLGKTEGESLQVGTVVEGSPAAKAGVEDGDIILRVGDRPGSHLAEVISGMKPGSPLTVRILREGEEKEITVVLGEREDEVRGRTITLLGPEGGMMRLVPQFEVPEGEGGRGFRFELAPEIRGRGTGPRARARAVEPFDPEEIRALRQEIRALREEVRALRDLIRRRSPDRTPR